MNPSTTRLRYVKSKNPDLIVAFCDKLGVRIQIYGAPAWTGKAWYLWFVPSDRGDDIKSINLDGVL